MKIVDHKIPKKARETHMKEIIAWARDRSAPAQQRFGDFDLVKTYKGQTVYVDEAMPSPQPQAPALENAEELPKED